jgi:hypothetical protein
LFKPPSSAGWMTIVARADGFRWVGERGEKGTTVEDFEK